MRGLREFLRNEEGSSVVEYALIGTIISIVAVGAVIALGGQMSGLFDTVVNAWLGA